VELILITNNLGRAAIAQEAGVDHIMVDLEINGKEARQGHLNTVISRHTPDDVRRISPLLTRSRLLVRINPLFDGSAAEIDLCVAARAHTIMLPMFTTAAEVDRFIALVAGRARTCLLLETPPAFVRSDDIARCSGVDVVHVGLNDLHLGMGLTFMFELLTHGQIERLADIFRARGINFGFGGVAPLGRGAVPAELILSEHVRLGSTQVILSRDFLDLFSADDALASFTQEVANIRGEIARLRSMPLSELNSRKEQLCRAVSQYVEKKHAERASRQRPFRGNQVAVE